MAFWGMSNTGREAQGMLNQIPSWMWDQFQQWSGRANALGPQSDAIRDWYIRELQNQHEQGFGTPEETAALGNRVAPGVEDALRNRWERLQQIRDSLQNVPGAESVMEQINAQIDDLGGDISRLQDETQGTIDRTYDETQRRGDIASEDVLNRTRGAYDRARRSTEGTYGDIRGDIQRTFGGLTEGSDTAFDEARRNLEMLKPGGEAETARVARSFAPMISATNRRLRAGGIMPNSLEGTTALRGVGTARARAMDDAMADSTRTYVGEGNKLTLGRQQARERLGLGRLGSEGDLMRELEGLRTGMTMGEAGDINNETLRRLGFDVDVLGGRANATIDNANTAYDRTRDYRTQRMNAPQLARQLGLQDFAISGDLNREQNDEELQGLDLRNWAFNQGVAHQARDLARRDTATGQLGNTWQQLIDNMLQFGNQAQGFGDRATQGFQNTYNREAPNAGWGRRLLGGLGMAALNLIPGAGTAANLARGFGGAAIGSLTGGGGGGFQMPQMGGFRTPPFNPNSAPAGNAAQPFNVIRRLQIPGAQIRP